MMKKLFSIVLVLLVVNVVHAQKLKDIQVLILQSKYKEAQKAINSFLAQPNNATNATGWYYKGQVYNLLSSDSTLKQNEQLALKLQSFDAYKQAQILDPKDENLKEDGYRPYLLIYAGLYDLGAAAFQKKDFATSYNGFTKAMAVEDYIKSKGYTYKEIVFPAFDTALVLNSAIAAGQANDTVNSIAMYTRFIDNNIGGADQMQVYEIVVDHYVRKKDILNAEKYIAISRRMYPGSTELWNDYSLRLTDKNDKSALMAKYEKLIQDNPKDFAVAYNYSVELYNSIYAVDEKRPANIAAAKKRLTEVLNLAIASDKGIDATMLMVNHMFNTAIDINNSYSIEKNAAKKAQFKKEADVALSAVIPYAEKVVAHFDALPQTTVKNRADKKNVLGYLMDIYDMKGNAAKSAEYDKLRSAVKL